MSKQQQQQKQKKGKGGGHNQQQAHSPQQQHSPPPPPPPPQVVAPPPPKQQHTDVIFDTTDPVDFFEVLAKLGEGSYGSVYKALDKRDGKLVAIKVLEVENEDTIELQKEVNILRECDCEWIVRYRGSYRKDGNIWIVMEFCGAGSLCDLMAICERTLTEEQIAIVMKMSLFGLEYLHSKRKIHRDIKSGNILINHDGDCKLADFGVSAELATTMSKRKTVIGTPYWMAPEVLQSTEYNGKADIWSLAITAIELAVGEPPHSNVHPMRAIFMIPNSDPPTLPDPSKWSADFNDFLKVCLVKNPEKRPTATQLLKTHPFIMKAKSKAIIAQLVDECMQEIDDYRAQEAAEAAAGGAGAGGADGTGTMQQAASGGGTMIASNGTMVQTSRGQSPQYEHGTMVFNQGGTLQQQHQQQQDEEYDEGAGGYDTGTMVLHPTTLAKAPSGATLEGKNGQATVNYSEPSYMRHIREASNKHKIGGGSSQTGTMLVSSASTVQHATMIPPAPGHAAAALAAQQQQQYQQQQQQQQLHHKPSPVATLVAPMSGLSVSHSSQATGSHTPASSNASSTNSTSVAPSAASTTAAASSSSHAAAPSSASASSFYAAAAVAPVVAAPVVVQPPPPVTPQDFKNDLYRTQRKFEVKQIEHLTKDELKSSISLMEKAYSAEKSKMEQQYDEQKKLIKKLIERKEQEAKELAKKTRK